MSINEFLKNLAIAVEDHRSDADTPGCPKCKGTMQFFGGNRKPGDGFWECPNCGYKVTETDLSPYIDEYMESYLSYLR